MGGPEEKVIFMQGTIMRLHLQPGGEAWKMDPLVGLGKRAIGGLRWDMGGMGHSAAKNLLYFLDKE
jgi:hypothetical protein